MKTLRITALTTATLILPLHLWRSIYPFSDWALLFLAVLAIVLFIGTFAPAVTVYRARLNISVRSTSPLAKLLTGRLHAGIVALAFTTVTIPVLAWQALTATSAEVVCLIVLCIAASGFSLGICTWFQPHLTSPFSRSAGIIIGAVAAAVVFVPLVAWINWNYASLPGEIRMESLPQAVMSAINTLPARRGWIAEILSFFYAMDAAKLWLVVQLDSSRWAAILFSLDSALVAFVVAHASATLTSFVSDKIMRPDQ